MISELPRLPADEPLPGSFSAAAAPFAVVLDGAGILLGAIDEKRAGALARDCINPAPQTIRADMTRRLAFKLLEHSPYLLVTDSEGRFLGRFVP